MCCFAILCDDSGADNGVIIRDAVCWCWLLMVCYGLLSMLVRFGCD